MENKFKGGDVIKFINWTIPESHAVRKNYGPLFTVNKDYIVSHVGFFDWELGKGKEACVCIKEIYGGWLPESLFIPIETEYLIYN